MTLLACEEYFYGMRFNSRIDLSEISRDDVNGWGGKHELLATFFDLL